MTTASGIWVGDVKGLASVAGMPLCEPLTENDLPSALAVTEQCFPCDIGYRWSLPAAAAPGAARDVLRAAGMAQLNHWIVKAEFDAVAGLFGLYTPDDELARQEGLILLHWFCVNPRFRGHGLGHRLWNETVTRAEQLGARRLVFYSSDEPAHRAAERLYVAAGCARRLGPQLRDCADRLTFFDLPLGRAPAASPALLADVDQLLHRAYAIDGDPALAAMANTLSHAGMMSVAA